MKKIIIAPDSFKETMTNIEVSNIIYDTLLTKYPNYEFIVMPVADGGEGSLYTIVKDINNIHILESNDANMLNCVARYGIVNNCGIVEVAENIGFKYKRKNSTPGNTTSYGVGEVIKELYSKGISKIYVCLGGTITNDAGCGMASALGIKFLNKKDKEFVPTGDTLINIKSIDNSLYLEQYKDLNLIGLCDVTNPLYGENGASYVFAPQKGATSEEVIKLDEGLKHLEQVVKESLNLDVAQNPGSGAAGGIGYAINSFLNGKLQKGIDTILKLMKFKDYIDEDCVVITGEGKLDSQSFRGKVINGILSIAKKKKTKVIAVVGTMDKDVEDYKKYGISEVVVSNCDNLPMSVVKEKCREQLKEAILKIEL